MLWEADLLGILPFLGMKKGSPTAARKVISQLVKLGLLVRHTGQRRLTDEVPSLHHLVIPKKATDSWRLLSFLMIACLRYYQPT
jgi:hypothetical protein